MPFDTSSPILIKNHLLEDHNHVFAGRHVIFDVFGSPFSANCKFVEQIMRNAVEAVGATVLHSHFHGFGEGCGFTGILVLSESHASVHTWPEVDLMTFDIYMCGICDPMQAMKNIIEKLQPKEHKITSLKRGIVRSHQRS